MKKNASIKKTATVKTLTAKTTSKPTITGASMNSIKSVKVYYGEATPSAISALSKYGAVIIEPYAFSKAQVDTLKAHGTKVYGYLSVMELEDQNKGLVNDSDYFYYHGKKYRIPQWKTYIMDLSKPHYQDILMNKVNSQIAAKDMDGVFLDTVGDIDDYFYKDPAVQNQFRQAYKTLLGKIKSSYPGLSLIQNWGFDTVKSTSAPYINGVMWEDFDKSVVSTDEWSQNWINYFRSVSGSIRLITVAPNTSSESYAQQLGFISTLNGNDIYNNL
ncbi:putative glycoside hydrolase [Sporolactobacillus shoreae]